MSEVGQQVGSVDGVWRYPVKSMGGELVPACLVGPDGFLGDRALAVLDVETGKVASAKSPRAWPNLLDFAAEFVALPVAGEPLPPVRIRFPDGGSVRTDDPQVESMLSGVFGRRVRLISSNPAGAGVFEQYLPPVEGADPEGGDFYRDVPNDMFGRGSLHDASPIHLLTTAMLDRLGELYPEGRFDVRRFRPNVVVRPADAVGFVENGWLKQRLQIGDARIRVTMATLRCVMTTRPQGDLPKDLGILRTATEHNRLQVLRLGAYPCVGVYGLVEHAGVVRAGDPVSLLMAPLDEAVATV